MVSPVMRMTGEARVLHASPGLAVTLHHVCVWAKDVWEAIALAVATARVAEPLCTGCSRGNDVQ